MAKYDALGKWLAARSGPTLQVDFDQLDRVVGGLPPSAHNHAAWWDNEFDGRHVQARGWLDAGWKVVELNIGAGWVKFQQIHLGSDE